MRHLTLKILSRQGEGEKLKRLMRSCRGISLTQEIKVEMSGRSLSSTNLVWIKMTSGDLTLTILQGKLQAQGPCITWVIWEQI
jgi:hypothetical protein